MPQLKVKKLSDSATIPSYATSCAACFDLHADLLQGGASGVFIGAGTVIGTGAAISSHTGIVCRGG